MTVSSVLSRSSAGAALRSATNLHHITALAVSSIPAAPSPTSNTLPPPKPKFVTTATRPLSPPPQFEPALWFNQSNRFYEGPGGPGPDPKKSLEPETNKVKLGKTLRILQERLPTLLQRPLPQEILAPNITLHLFPSTHQNLPTVSGKVAYIAALWTSPIAWNRIPLFSNVRIEIMSERMTNQPYALAPRRPGCIPEQLIVKWKTIGGSKSWGFKWMGTAMPAEVAKSDKKEFTGLFIFEFNREGRILSHTIENMQDGEEREKVSKVVGLTDWLLGGMRGGDQSPATCQRTNIK
ncbi:hypothetical protein MKZ38_003765 [Zalerion maritima]|uniref:Uncharacterized protein n=1 Tax=Zalerion maritima TaxID=339359 RepID=A0AAD5WQF1_9PEZI|nr:hypothetical protein MKZ38_003765 [Zalerion maritima]